MTEVLRCSFCNKDQHEVRKLIAGPTVFICDECVAVCVDIIADDTRVDARPCAPSEASGEAGGQPDACEPPPGTARCSLCRAPTRVRELLPIPDRGVLCGACADAIDDALARGAPLTDETASE